MSPKLRYFIQLGIFLLVAFATNFDYGFSTTYMNTPVDYFKYWLNETFIRRGQEMSQFKYDIYWNLILNCWFVGFFIGTFLSPMISDKYGRKVSFLSSLTISMLCSIGRYLSILFYLPEFLIVCRFLTSIMIAVLYMSQILFLQECSPTELRGFNSFLSEISYAIMTLFGTLLGTPGILGNHLAILVLVPVPFMIFFLASSFFLHETPKFLYLVKKDQHAAERSIHFYHGPNSDAKAVLNEIDQEALQDETGNNVSSWLIIKEIFTIPHLRKALMLSCAALQNTVALWAILLSSTKFLEDAHLPSKVASWSSNAMTLSYAIATVIGSSMVEKLGRRPLLISFSIANSVSLAVFVTCDQLQPFVSWLNYGCLVAFISYGYTYGMAVGPISWFISSELVPQRYRSLTQSLSYAINTIMVVISTFTVLPFYDLIGSYCFLILYVGPSIICIIYLYKCLPETKGREIHDIVRELKGEFKEFDEKSNDLSTET